MRRTEYELELTVARTANRRRRRDGPREGKLRRRQARVLEDGEGGKRFRVLAVSERSKRVIRPSDVDEGCGIRVLLVLMCGNRTTVVRGQQRLEWMGGWRIAGECGEEDLDAMWLTVNR